MPDGTNGWTLPDMTRHITVSILGTQGDVIGCGLVRPSRGYRIYCYSGYPRECRKWAWPGATRRLNHCLIQVPKDMLRIGVAYYDLANIPNFRCDQADYRIYRKRGSGKPPSLDTFSFMW